MRFGGRGSGSSWVAGAVLLGSALLLTPAMSFAQVSGKVLINTYRPLPAANKKPSCYWELENGFKEVKPDRIDARRELAVVLIGAGDPVPQERVEVALSGGGLMPSTIVVRTGTTVLFRNDDEIAHELYAEGLSAVPAETTGPRGRRSVSLPNAGAWPLRDRLVTHVEGQLYVLPDLIAVATIDADGQFGFKDVPPGKYTLKVLLGGQELTSQPVEVGAKPLALPPIALTGAPAKG